MHSDDWLKDDVIDFEFTIVTVFLFIWSLSPHFRIVHSYGYVTITVERIEKIWPMLGTHGHSAERVL